MRNSITTPKDHSACHDCSLAGWGPMVQESLWQQITSDEEILLCPGCIEKRLGRPLTPDDLTDCVMNQAALYFLEKSYAQG